MAVGDVHSKINIFLTSQGGTAPTGWTETFWSQDADLNNQIKLAKDYALVRAKLLGIGAQVEYLRVSNFPANRVTQIYYMQGNAGTSKFEGAAFTTDPTQVDLLVRMQTDPGKRRSFWMCGLPDIFTNQLIQQGIEGAFLSDASFKAWVATIKANKWCIRFLTGKNPNTYKCDQVVQFTPIMVRNRKKGRPFDLFRGRKLA